MRFRSLTLRGEQIWFDSIWLAVVADAVHRAETHRAAHVALFAFTSGLAEHEKVSRVVAVHEIAQRMEKAHTTSIAVMGNVVLPRCILFVSHHNVAHIMLRIKTFEERREVSVKECAVSNKLSVWSFRHF